MDLTGRVAWAINKIKGKTSLSWPKLAHILGTNKNTVADYANQKGEKILAVVIERIASEYNYSAEWLLEGKGEPYPGAKETDPEVCGHLLYNKEPAAARDKEGLWGQTKHIERGGARFSVTTHEPKKPGYEMGNGPAIDSLLYILQSDNHSIVRAILSNLEAFSGAIRDQNQAKARIERLEAQNEELQRRVEILEMKIETMMKASEEKKDQEQPSTKCGEQQSPQASSL